MVGIVLEMGGSRVLQRRLLGTVGFCIVLVIRARLLGILELSQRVELLLCLRRRNRSLIWILALKVLSTQMTVFVLLLLLWLFFFCCSAESMGFVSTAETKADFQEELLLDFSDDERNAIFKVCTFLSLLIFGNCFCLQIAAANSAEDLNLFAKLCRKGYFQGQHHVEEIMYLENLRRSQLLQLLDKFRDVLITYETEDPAIAMFSCSIPTIV